ncbi:MAG: Pseudaminic acid synthase [Cellulomonadaceae bacterium TMED98]|nr:MAG: Pseudaminic acid synthase [Cellulomonadaceae bacterium TMED98]
MNPLGKESPTVIAEMSANHNGSLERALALIAEAARAGSDFVKFQHYRPETITVKGSSPDLRISGGTQWDGSTLWDLYSSAMTPWEWTEDLVDACNTHKIGWLSTPFDESAVDFLEGFNPPFYKIASFEIINLPLIRYVAGTKKPLVISTGMATVGEIDAAFHAAVDGGASEVILLRTNSGYPAPISEMDLASLPYMAERWQTTVGLSDHTLGNTSAIVALALGAQVFEKHLTISRADGGPDAAFSAEPEEMRDYIHGLREAQASIGTRRFGPSPGEEKSVALRPSLRALKKIREGELFTSENVAVRRPSGGLPPERLHETLGRRALQVIDVGSPITANQVDFKV